MPSLELNAEHDEVKASGARGYILLYLDNKPSMRWRFYNSMKLKLEWEDESDLTNIKQIGSSFLCGQKRSAQSHLEPSSSVSDLHLEIPTPSRSTPFSLSRTESLKLSSSTFAPEGLVVSQTRKKEAGNMSTLGSDFDNDEDDSTFGNESEDSSFSLNKVSSTSVKAEHLGLANEPQVKVEQGVLPKSALNPAMQLHKSSIENKTVETKKNKSISFGEQKEGEKSPEKVKKSLAPGRKKSAEKALMKGITGKCQLCVKPLYSLRNHFALPNKKLKCPSCNVPFKSQAHLILHQDTVHNIEISEIEGTSLSDEKETSSKSTIGESEFDKKKQGQNRWHPCPICSVKYRYDNLVNHIKRFHTNESVFKCCICDKGLSTMRHVKDHIKDHLGIERKKGKWHCSLCSAIFSSNSEFQLHSHTHRVVCAFCHKDFSFRKLLYEHYQTEHKDSLIPCRICGYEVATKRQLWTHERHHKYTKPIPCHICGTLVKKSSLNAHMRCHKDGVEEESRNESDIVSATSQLSGKGTPTVSVNKYLCSMCPETFPTEGWLVRHLTTIHKQVIGVKCPQCPKRFATNARLSDHILRHVNFDKKLYICALCGKSFGSNHTRKAHMNIHQPVKSFSCNICGQGFNYKVSLQTHMVSKHGFPKNK